MSSKHLYLIDGSGYIFRAYYAIRPLATSKGLPTNALYGFTQMLLKLQKEVQPQYWAIIFDSKEPTFRDDLYDQYKANRKEPPDDLVPQFEYFPKIVSALNVPMMARPGFEADDIIATLVQKATKIGFEITVISGDKDLMQLVGPHVRMWDTMKEKHYDLPDVFERFGVAPDKVTDLFGLMGDSSDNIPGVPGIGPKTASKLIQEFGDLEAVLKNTDKLQGKIKESIEKFGDQARLSKQLAALHTDVPLEFREDLFKHRPIDPEKTHQLFRELEFSRLLAELAPKETLSKQGYKLIMKESELKELADKISKNKNILSLDLETDSLDVMIAKIVGISLSWEKGEAAYIPIGHVGEDIPKQIALDKVLDILKPLLRNGSVPKVGQNLKYDLAILKRHGVEVDPIYCDTMIASYLLNPQGPHNLDDLAQQFLDHKTIRYEEVVGKGSKQKLFSAIPLELARDYAAEDADCAWQMAQIFMTELSAHKLSNLFNKLELPLMQVLLKMEMNGILVDPKILQQLSDEFEGEIKNLEGDIFKLAGESFNINSPKQLGEILFAKLKLPGGKKTKTGYSTEQSILEALSVKHALPEKILTYRSLSKLKSTYTDALQKLINKETKRIHTSFNQTIAQTGRLSSSDPNLQNIPIRTEEGKKIRAAFVAPEGFLLLSADYSQIELRILAHFTLDFGLMKAFKEGQDVHELTAKALNADRGVGKTVNFATIYGQSAFGLSQQLKIDVAEASQYIENYFKKYPTVKEYREKILKEARQIGHVETLMGRRRFFPDILSRNIHVKNNAERMAFNTVFQGSAADIIKKAMIDIDSNLQKISPQARMILQVHDELVFEVPASEIEKVKAFVKEKMEKAHTLKVPLVVECGVGKNWAEAH